METSRRTWRRRIVRRISTSRGNRPRWRWAIDDGNPASTHPQSFVVRNYHPRAGGPELTARLQTTTSQPNKDSQREDRGSAEKRSEVGDDPGTVRRATPTCAPPTSVDSHATKRVQHEGGLGRDRLHPIPESTDRPAAEACTRSTRTRVTYGSDDYLAALSAAARSSARAPLSMLTTL